MTSSDTAAQTFSLLVDMVEQHYYHDQCSFPAACSLRKKVRQKRMCIYYSEVICSICFQIFNAILSLRADKDGRLGYHDNSGTNYSLFYVCQRWVLVT